MLFKFGAYLYTGSGTMLSESIHSLADMLNQVFLIRQKKNTLMHCFGLTCLISVCCRYWLIGAQHYASNVPLQELIFCYFMSFVNHFL